MYSFNREDIIVSAHPEPVRHGMTTGKIHSGIKVHHKPTGIVVVCEKHRHQHRNKEEALQQLEKLLQTMQNIDTVLDGVDRSDHLAVGEAIHKKLLG